MRANLPHAGYGQGEVVATPLADGARRRGARHRRRHPRGAAVVGPAASPQTRRTRRFVPPAPRDTLASYLRDAVVSGTGRLLKDHPARIAGKTGTAEVDEAGSHAWFVGFAPLWTGARGALRSPWFSRTPATAASRPRAWPGQVATAASRWD